MFKARNVMAALLLMDAGFVYGQADLSHIEWVTNNDAPPIGSPKAKRGGTFDTYMTAYPLTFRLHGPNSNHDFAAWNRSVSLDRFALVTRHPTTDEWIPSLGTHWSIQDDGRTVFFKLDRDARWSDGKPITADDYVFAFEFLRTKAFPLPFYNEEMEKYFETVEKLDDYTIKITGKQKSWRPLWDYYFYPLPRHAIQIDAEWPIRDNYRPPVVPGPYVISSWREGERVELTRVENWWGDEKRYFKGLYNPDRIVIRIISDRNRAFDYFKRGEIDFYTVVSSGLWAREMDFEAVQKGWVHRKREFVGKPQGMAGLAMNLQAPLFQSKDFRKALQYLFPFDELNDNLMFGCCYRIVSAFEGTEYQNPELEPYGFDPRKAREHLARAGFHTRGDDGILVNERGGRASFSVIYGEKGFEGLLAVVKNVYQRAGVEMRLQLMEPGAAFERGLEKAFEMLLFLYTGGEYPDPHEYFSSELAKATQNNNLWGFGQEEVDELIDIYRYDMDEHERLQAMHRIDAIVQDEAFYIPLWQGPFLRFAYWDNVQFPDSFFPKRTQQFIEWQVFWIDEDRERRLAAAKASGSSLGEDEVIDVDPYGIALQLSGREN